MSRKRGRAVQSRTSRVTPSVARTPGGTRAGAMSSDRSATTPPSQLLRQESGERVSRLFIPRVYQAPQTVLAWPQP